MCDRYKADARRIPLLKSREQPTQMVRKLPFRLVRPLLLIPVESQIGDSRARSGSGSGSE